MIQDGNPAIARISQTLVKSMQSVASHTDSGLN